MAASAKFDPSTNSPDGSGYLNGQRGPYGISLDRSGSFREGSENRLPSSIAGSSRSFSMFVQADAVGLSQSLLTDLKMVVLDQKCHRQGDVKKLITVMGVPQDDSSSHNFTKVSPAPCSEEFKRAKSSLHDTVVKARDRAKYFGDLISKYDKYFPSNFTKKRSRSDVSSSERSNSLLSGVNMTKSGPQVHPNSGDLPPHRTDERSKAGIPNRRIRTSMTVDTRMEHRSNASLKPCTPVGKERDTIKLVGGNVNLTEEKPHGVGWERKMKKKRTGVKPEVSDQNVVATRSTPSERESKQGLQQRLNNDAQPRLSNTLGFRTSAREDTFVGSPASATNRPGTTARAPRSIGGPSSRASPSVHRTSGSPDESDVPPFTNKSSSGIAPGNRKRSAPSQSSSPPVSQWIVQRHHKPSRSARRTHFPLVSAHDDNPFDETYARTNEGVDLSRHVSVPSGQVKAIGDHPYSTGLSESEESTIVENKSKEKVKKCPEVEEKGGHILQRATTPSFPSRKSKTSGEGEDELGDGTRRVARPVRGFPPLRPGGPSTTEKPENAGSAKQPRNVKLDPERGECKPGRPTTKKYQERKGFSRPRCDAVELPEAEDDHEELLAAANSALNTRYACSSSFWKRMEPYFAFVSSEESVLLKKQSDLGYRSLSSVQDKVPRDGCEATANGVGFNKCDLGLSAEAELIYELSPEDAVQTSEIHSGISICQLLLSAMIEEADESEPYYCTGREEECFSNDTYSIQFVNNLDTTANGMDHLPLENSQRVRAYANGYITNARCRYYDEPNRNNLENYNTGPEYSQMHIEDRILLELNEIGLCPEPMPDLAQSEDEDINEVIRKLEEKLHGEVILKRNMLSQLEKTVAQVKELQERELERIALDKLVGIAYGKYMAHRGTNASASKNTNKIARLRLLSFVKRTLARCQAFEQTGKSCFSEPPFREMFQSFNRSTIDPEGADAVASHSSLATQAALKNSKHEKFFETALASPSEHALGKDDLWSNKVKKRELLLNVGVGNLVSGTKGKRSERDRDGKRSNRDATARTGSSRVGRPALSNAKGERKNKTKPKHKMTQMSASLSDILGSDTLLSAPKQCESVDGNTKLKDGSNMTAATPGSQDAANDRDAMDFSSLQLPGIDVLGVTDDFGSQPQDFGTWFSSFDDEGLQDQDLVGLEIPMDDLSDLNMVL